MTLRQPSNKFRCTSLASIQNVVLEHFCESTDIRRGSGEAAGSAYPLLLGHRGVSEVCPAAMRSSPWTGRVAEQG